MAEFPQMNPPLGRPFNGMICGGGVGAFIGPHHVMAATMHRRSRLVAGAFSDDKPDLSKGMASFYDVAPDRAYRSWREMFDAEMALPFEQRPDFVIVATPNKFHFEIAKAAILLGLNVICEKPLTMTVEEALELQRLVQEKGVVFAVPHGYTCWPMTILAAEMVSQGRLGKILGGRVVYIQGWLAELLEKMGVQQAEWRTDPALTGVGGCLGDIAVHALIGFTRITKLAPSSVLAVLKTTVSGRKNDDYCTAIVRFPEDVLLTLTASQVTVNRKNDIRIEVDGSEASLEWAGENPNELVLNLKDGRREIYTDDPNAAWAKEYPLMRAACSWPGGHPEGLHDAWSVLYGAAFNHMALRRKGQPFDASQAVYPNVDDGVLGMKFIHAAFESQASKWVGIQ